MFVCLYIWKTSVCRDKKMSVDKVNYNNINPSNALPKWQYVSRNPGRAGESNIKNNFNFTGRATQVATVSVPEIKELLMKLMPPIFRGMQKMKNSIGEFQNIVINSIGTGLVAPVLIKYNFLSKTDEDTRTYTAWRQPVSAVLAVLTQALITLPFDYVINKMVNNGEFGIKYNLTFAPDEKLLSQEIKKEYKAQNKRLSKSELAALVKERKQKQFKEVVNTLLTENKINFSKYNDPNLVSLPPEELKQLAIDTIQEELKIEQSELEKSYRVKTPSRIQRTDFFRTHPEESLDFLNEVNSIIDSSTTDKDLKSKLRHKLKALKKAEANTEPEIIRMMQEIYDRHSYKDKKTKRHIPLKEITKQKILGMIADHKTYSRFKTFASLQRQINEEGVKRVNEIDGALEVLKAAKKSLETNPNITINEVYETIKRSIQDKGVKARLEDFKLPEAMVKRLEKLVKSNVSALKQMSGLVVSFAMLPVTCALLNWTYPRFMDLVFPNLSNKKHDTESSNLIERATKKAEGGNA